MVFMQLLHACLIQLADIPIINIDFDIRFLNGG